MSDPDARKRILDMLAAGHITVDAATDLLRALGGSSPQPPAPPPPLPKARGPARMLRISVDGASVKGRQGAKVRILIPLALAKYASRFLPEGANAELSMQGIDLAQLLKDIGDDVPDGRILGIEADDESGGGKTTIVIEVV